MGEVVLLVVIGMLLLALVGLGVRAGRASRGGDAAGRNGNDPARPDDPAAPDARGAVNRSSWMLGGGGGGGGG
ncbi:hypothetical protein [Modestobacter sp. VKM Ac-2984]|uniref:hypothetical protein n=1 Tax=Modestobacter sp. VKM Ac-2984 TaxID=3004138 RepID=UPI0022AA2654|nr:hypothetical protein [Modestobacter sp. VKM Ac-2984]MCZ2817191.1 hypothetical protein [Modestobacter sp. VKM Ac-2984]